MQIVIRSLNHVVKVAIGHFEILKVADVPVGRELWINRKILKDGQFALLHKDQLMRVIFAPFQRPAIFLLKFKNVASLRIDLENIEGSTDIDECQPGGVRIYSNHGW